MSDASISITQQIANESTQGTLNLVDAPTLPAIPAPQPTIDALMKTMTAVKAILDAREGNGKTSVLDQNLTLRDLMNEGALGIQIGQNLFSGTAVSALDMGTGYQNPLPVLVVPPTPTALTAQGAFKNVVLDWALFAYANAAYVEVWRSGSNALGTAVLLGTSTANLYTDANVVTGTTYYYWVRAIAIGGAAGPFNAVGGTAGALLTVAGTDLSALAVSADKLSQGTYPNINLVPNGSAEDGLVCWAAVQTSGASFSLNVDTAVKTGGLQGFRIDKTTPGVDGVGYGCLAFPVIPGETYSVKLRARASAAIAAGFYINMFESIAKPPSGYVGVPQGFDSVTSLFSNGPLTTSFALFEFSYVVPAGVNWVSISAYNWSTSTAASVYFDDVSVGRQITASFLAANSIAVGTAAIQNGALVNAMIANLAVDNAKIANATITGGKIAVQTITAGNVAAGTLTANEIAANTIRTGNMLITGQGAALNDDPGCADISAWDQSIVAGGAGGGGGSIAIVSTTTGPAGISSLRLTSLTGGFVHVRSRLMACTPGKTYRLSLYLNPVSGAGSYYARISIIDGTQTVLKAFNTGLENFGPGAGWNRYVGTITAPAGSALMCAEVYANLAAGGPGVTDIQDFRLEEAVPASLIVDGTITTQKIVVTAVTAAQTTAFTGSGTAFTAVSSVNISNINVISAFTSTGAPVTVSGVITFQLVCTAGAPANVFLTVNPTFDGVSQGNLLFALPTFLFGANTDLNVTLPVSFQVTPSAAAHSYGFQASFVMSNSAGAGVASTGTYTVTGKFIAQENKV